MSRRNHRKQMRRFIRRRTPPGSSPGIVAPDPNAPRPVVRAIAYSAEKIVEREVSDLESLARLRAEWPVVWVNIDGLGDARTIETIGRQFGLHPLAMEDVVNVHQRAKVEEYPDHLFIVARMVTYEAHLQSEQISLFLGPGFLITFQERSGDVLEPVRERLRASRGKLRASGADYLAYSILDAVVDSYFPVLERCGERIDQLDLEVADSPAPSTVAKIHDLRAELLMLRRAIWPHRDALSALVREEHPLIKAETKVYLRDCYDHTIQIFDILETDRDLCSDLRDFYLSSISLRTNDTMRVLTVIATLFMPLNFIAAVYGMNFDYHASHWNMPELHWRFGYPAAMLLMTSVALGMLAFFFRKGWIGRQRK